MGEGSGSDVEGPGASEDGGEIPLYDWRLRPLTDSARAARIVTAVLDNIENWRDRVLEIESHANPGNKVRALALARDLEMARVSLGRLAGRAPDDAR